jgi:hypothetical protein
MKTYFEIVAESVMEKYSPDNTNFLQYMKGGDFDPYQHWSHIASWLVDNYPDETNEAAGEEVTWNDLANSITYDADFFYKLPEHIQKECAQDIIGTILHHDPADAPTTAHMTLGKDRLIPRTTWLIHFSDNAREISLYGFKYGMDEMDKLGLTTWFSDEAKKHGGYNFAYDANYRNADSGSKYGREAVMFMNSGVKCDHHGDQEEQIVFWGADVDPRDIVFIANDGGTWKVINKNQNRGLRPLFVNDDMSVVIQWVQANFAQYRRAMGCR